MNFKTIAAAEGALGAARKANSEADLMIKINAFAKGGKFSVIERPDHLKKPSIFDGLSLSQFMAMNSVA